MFLRCLVMFLHLYTYAFESAQKAMSCMIPIYQSGVFSQNVDFITSNDASYQNDRHGFGTTKGHPFTVLFEEGFFLGEVFPILVDNFL